MEWYDFILFGLAVLGTGFYGYLEGYRAGFTKGTRAGKGDQ